MHDLYGRNLTPCEKCKRPGAIPVAYSGHETRTLCPECDKVLGQEIAVARERDGWNVDAALGKTYEYKKVKRVPRNRARRSTKK